MILVVVRRAGWNKSPWESYSKTFDTVVEFLDWWNGLPDDSYTKQVSREYNRVRVFEAQERDDLLVLMVIPPVDSERR